MNSIEKSRRSKGKGLSLGIPKWEFHFITVNCRLTLSKIHLFDESFTLFRDGDSASFGTLPSMIHGENFRDSNANELVSFEPITFKIPLNVLS